jgi:uncharacterized protein (DUF2267 family)
MSVTGLEVFDTTVHKTNTWLKRLMAIAGWHDRHLAYLGLRATLHALRDRLTVEEAAELAAQLPMLVRGIYYEGWDPSGKPLRIRHRDEFLAAIQRELPPQAPLDAEPAARAVFQLLSERVADGEIDEVRQVLPAEIRELWSTAPVAGAMTGSKTAG